MHNHLNARQGAIFLEVQISDASDFATTVHVGSAVVGGHYILRATGPSVPNVLAAVLLDVRDRVSKPPHIYFEWSEKATGAERAALPARRRGRHPPADPRDHPACRARRGPAPAGARRRLSARAGHTSGAVGPALGRGAVDPGLAPRTTSR